MPKILKRVGIKLKNQIMKNFKILIAATFSFTVLFTQLSFAQQWNGSNTTSGDIYRTGQVGIGYSSGSSVDDALEVNGTIGCHGNLEINGDIQGVAPGHATFSIFANTNDSNGSFIKFWGAGWSSGGVDFNFGNRLDFLNGGNQEVMRIDPNDNVVIGGAGVGAPPAGFRLAVADGIISQQVKVVGSSANWADYVFAKNYPLTPIEEVESYIKLHKHLPNVPSAKEVKENGIEMVEMDATLLRQIEELWLHMIDLKKENEALKVEIQQLKEK